MWLLVAVVCALLPFSPRLLASAGCPHLGALHQQGDGGGGPPGIQPGDERPPAAHYIHATYGFRAVNDADRRYAKIVASTLARIRDATTQDATIIDFDFEQIDCGKAVGQEASSCADWPTTGAFHYFVAEDATAGAAVYDLEQERNGEDATKVEAALLDALSRHAPVSLTRFASGDAEKAVGFVRRLGLDELQRNAQTGEQHTHELKPGAQHLLHVSPLELNVIDANLLELRDSGTIDLKDDGNLFEAQAEPNLKKAIERHRNLFVLFWTTASTPSVHAWRAFADASKLFHNLDQLMFAHVRCHEYPTMCVGLGPIDLTTVVAFKNGDKAATWPHVSAPKALVTWMELVINGPLLGISDELGALDDARRGKLSSLTAKLCSVTVAVVSSDESSEFSALAAAAEKLVGKHAVAVRIREGANSSLSTYRCGEKRRRTPYSGEWDPRKIELFVRRNALPSIFNISQGFSTGLFGRPIRVNVLIAKSDVQSDAFRKLATDSVDDRRQLFARIDIDRTLHNAGEAILERIFRKKRHLPLFISFDGANVYILELQGKEDQLERWLANRDQMQPDLQLKPSDVHPLRLLQKSRADGLFGAQDHILLPDSHPKMPNNAFGEPQDANDYGGCPVMRARATQQQEQQQQKRDEL